MNFLDMLIWNFELLIAAAAHSVVHGDLTALSWVLVTREPGGLALLGFVTLILASLAFWFLALALSGAATLGRAIRGAYGTKGIVAYAVLWLALPPIMLVVSAVLAFMLTRMPATVRLLGSRYAAAAWIVAHENARWKEHAKHDALMAPSRRADRLF